MGRKLHMRLSAAGARTVLSRIHSDRILACSEALVNSRGDEEEKPHCATLRCTRAPRQEPDVFQKQCATSHILDTSEHERTQCDICPGHALIGIIHIVTLSAIQLGHANTQKVDTQIWYSLVWHTSERPALHTWPMYMLVAAG